MRLLDVNDLSYSIGRVNILSGTSMHVDEGETVAVIGPNGAGKSTLLKCIIGVNSGYKGEIKLKVGCRIGYVPQKLEFDREFPITVEEFFRINTGVNDFVSGIIKRLDIDSLFQKKLGSLSGGELQRVIIALCISRKPNLILMDEPSSGIDMGNEKTIYSLIEELQKNLKFSILLVSHDIDFVSKFADRVYCLNKEMKCSGSPDEVFAKESLAKVYGSDLAHYTHCHD